LTKFIRPIVTDRPMLMITAGSVGDAVEQHADEVSEHDFWSS
jgi:hypothetical protein